MINPVVFATHLSRVLDLFRDPGRKEDQKREFRALVGLLKFAGVGLRVHAGALEVNGEKVESPEFVPLVARLQLHSINEMNIPQNAPVNELFELLRALADQPGGTGDVAARLHASGAYRVSVMLARLNEDDLPPVAAPPAPPTPPVAEQLRDARDSMGTSGVLRGEPLRDIRSGQAGAARESLEIEHIESAESEAERSLPQPEAATPREESLPELPTESPLAPEPERPEPEPAPSAATSAELSSEEAPPEPAREAPAAATAAVDTPAPPPAVALDEFAPPSEPLPPAPPPPVAPAAAPAAEPSPERAWLPAISQGGSAQFALKEARTREATEVLSTLERNPAAGNIGDVLAVLSRQVEGLLRAGKIEQMVEVVAGVVAIEKSIEDPNLRRQYAIALKRMVSKHLLSELGKLVQGSQHEAEAGAVLQRAGADGAEVLLDLLATSSTIQERRGIYNVLVQMKESGDQLVHMLGHPQWFVVRNVADLMGELGLEPAVPALAKALEHSDERVRKAVALALAKIGTRQAAEPLRRALRDKDPGVRIQAALGVNGRKASALAMPLVVALEEEKDTEVGKELVLALGRIASPDSVQALIKIAQPSGKLFGRKPTALRLNAVEALRLAATPAALGTLQGLSNDGDKQVRNAAQQALQDLKAKPA